MTIVGLERLPMSAARTTWKSGKVQGNDLLHGMDTYLFSIYIHHL